MKKLIIYGISGNIGAQALEVLRIHHNYELVAFSVGNNIKVIPLILKEHKKVKAIYVRKETDAKALKKKYPKIRFYYGDDGLIKLLDNHHAEMFLNALVGFVGLAPTLKAIELNIDIALANKESLVVGGELVKKALKSSKSKMYPVDSEHSAIYKCYKSVKRNDVKEIILTASGGAFRHLSRNELKKVTSKAALKHPTWQMGQKVTIDSASMLNKGFEIIEAAYLFNMPNEKIKVLMHDESYVHSILLLNNGCYVGEVNPPSMKNPIAYALKNEHKAEGVKKVKQLKDFGPYHFHEFNPKRYPMVEYARYALTKKGILPCVLNAVDEVAVDLFLKGKISFLDIERIIGLALKTFKNIMHPSYQQIVESDQKARTWAKKTLSLGGTL